MPTLWFAAPFFGRYSEIWLKRQAERITRLDVEAIAWGVPERPDWTMNAPTHLIDALPPARRWLPDTPESPAQKWAARLLAAPGRNFYRAGRRSRHVLNALAQTRPPSVILAHYGHTGLAMLPTARRFGVPIVVHFHGLDLSSSLRNRWYRWSLMSQLDRFDRIVVVGRRQHDWLIEQGFPEDRLDVIPCGVPVAQFRRDASPARVPARFITVSRLVAQKGVDVCLDAFAQIAPEIPAATLTVVGDGPERAALEARAAQAGLGERVRFTGSLPEERVREELQQASVFLQHSLDLHGWYEGFGVSVTEAAAMEMAVIVSRCGGLTDQVIDGETGFVVAQGDAAGMAQAMRKLAADPALCERMGAAGRANAAAHFDTDGQVDKLEAVLMAAMEQTAHRVAQ